MDEYLICDNCGVLVDADEEHEGRGEILCEKCEQHAAGCPIAAYVQGAQLRLFSEATP